MALLNTLEAAAYLKYHPDTLRRKVRAKQVPAVRIGAGRYRFRKETLDEWIAQGCPSQQQQPSLFE
jgi:excisionase family DNA binding protein